MGSVWTEGEGGGGGAASQQGDANLLGTGTLHNVITQIGPIVY